ncbi:uncharacterized protein K452DRAFT_292355 [Aplosporella prunicola CBS 121167]|uniref:F-box domain-containing protein n=1 Tax=Aplosporella prunicola CBS 121167 TaxID=1176127 RepID=A0A6A6AY24_9PEZI|nr:uncharacterized protein K452DRAFT_292355 [Aplosporella prunicola CBS 121167]KAF2136506.1 hypothetical protein K452DRAFT_292355 [Aplosporella prunicola CBS 121167]
MKFQRIAAQLDQLPVELIEPILSDLKLSAILNLSAVGSPYLVSAIRGSPTWGKILTPQLPDATHAYKIWIRVYHLYIENANERSNPCRLLPVYTDLSRLLASSPGVPELRDAHAGSITTKIWECTTCLIEKLFQQLFTYDWDFEDLKALCMFIPWEEISATDASFNHTIIPGARDETTLALYAQHFRGPWPLQRIEFWLPHFERGQQLLKKAKAAELRALGDLYSSHGTFLKKAAAPQLPSRNPQHERERLYGDAERVLGFRNFRQRYQAVFGYNWKKQPVPYRPWYRFSNYHPNIVPYDRHLQLFVNVLIAHPLPPAGDSEVFSSSGEINTAMGRLSLTYPTELIPDLQKAIDGLAFVYQHGQTGEQLRKAGKDAVYRTENTPFSALEKRGDGKPAFCIQTRAFCIQARGIKAMPHDERELEWLRAFVNCCAWMETEFPDLVGP